MFENLDKKKRVPFALAAAAIIMVTIVAIIWVLQPKYESIAQQLSIEESAQIIKKLNQGEVDYQVVDGGAGINVSKEHYSNALVNLVEDNRLNAIKGLELYDNADYSMTEHAQNVTYKRAIQGELERTLAGFAFIRHARVHVTFAKKRLFSSETESAKASVSIELNGAEQVSETQIRGIQELVATSIEQLDPQDVSVIDMDGNILSSSDGGDSVAQVSYKVEDSYASQIEKRVEKILALYFLPQQYAVSANVQTNQDLRTETIHSVVPAGKGAILKEKQYSKELEANETVERELGQGVLEQNSEIEYAHGKKVEEIKYAENQISKMSVAVAIFAKVDEQQTEQLKRLVKAAAGIKDSREDLLSFEVLTPAFDVAREIANTKEITDEVSNVNAAQTHGENSNLVESQNSESGVWLNGKYILLFVLFLFFVLAAELTRRYRLQLNSKNKEMIIEDVNQWLLNKEVSK